MNDPQIKLMVAFNFSGEDLQANHDGYLTKQQRSKLNRDRTSWKIFLALTLATIPFGTIWAIIDGIHIHDTVASRIGIIGLIWIVCGVIAVYIWLDKKRLDRDLYKGEVQHVEGRVEVGERLFRQRGTPRYYVRIQGISWNTDFINYSAFKHGDPYVIYYAPHSKTILSAEWLGKSIR